MWYIWKARNDNRFQRKTWTPMQVYNAVAAHINTHLQAQQAGNEAATTQSTQPLQLTDLADHNQQGAPRPLPLQICLSTMEHNSPRKCHR